MSAEAKSKSQRFLRLAEARTNRVLNDLRLVGNLSNRSNYEYTEEEASNMIRAIEEEVSVLKNRFKAANASRNRNFRLRGN